MKKYSALLGALVIGTMAMNASQALAFGIGNLTAAIPGVGGSTGSAVSAGDIDAFIKTAQDADMMIGTATAHIFKAVANKEEIAALEAKEAAANSIADPAEKAAAINKIKDDQATAVQKALSSKDVQGKLNGMSKAQLAAFGNAAFTFMLGVLKDKQLADGSRALVAGVASNPVLLPRLGALKDVATSVSAQAANTAKIGEGLVKLASAGKIAALPTSASEAPKPVDNI
ncbi:hypothetical protein Q8F57_000165 [Paraburkholderia terrae]|uniref:hypothetical protein n=1 Tax=Paraburkholderia terrae TaxID=311230 RepID=UPI00296B31CC|nr:hypothetical protein [Paraburkholderia terrae]MDW3661727.1 hypothetical protein [Paraburkholderia terrae]